jgi:hypothetical protein
MTRLKIKTNRFLQDALDRYAAEWDGEPKTSTDILFALKLRNGKPLHKSRLVGGETAKYQAQSLCFAMKRHPKFYQSTKRLNSKQSALWSCIK